MLANGLDQARPASGVEFAHGSHMGVVVAVVHEARQGQLQDLRRVSVDNAARRTERRHQLRWQHHVADAQAGIEGLAEGADVEGALVAVQALHAGGRQAVVVELAVVVVLDDPLAVFRCPVDQLQAPLQAQGRARGILVRRGDVHATGTAAVGAQQVGADAVGIDVDRHDPRLRRFKGLLRAKVAGVLQQDRFAGVDQHLRAKEQCLTGTAEHQHLLGRHLGAAFQVQVGGNGLAQGLAALWVAVQQDVAAMVFNGLALQAFPDLQRERAGFRQAGGKGLDCLLVADAAVVEQYASALAQALAGLQIAAFLCLGADAPLRAAAQFGAKAVRDIAARALATQDVAIALQLHVGVLDGVAGDPQRLGQGAAGGQLDAAGQGAFKDQCAQGTLDALVQVQRRELGVVDAHLQGFKLERGCHVVCRK
ncbi:hypothetical protein D3C79_643650 [compost metagenome]